MKQQKFTKIVATISDLRCDVDFLRALYQEGMNVVRMNSAHLSHDGFMKIVRNVRAVSRRIPLLIDTKGPEIRTTRVANGQSLEFVAGQRVEIVGDPLALSTKQTIAVSYKHFVRDIQEGAHILMDDGELEFKVIEKQEQRIVCEVLNDGRLGSRKGVNVPGVRMNLPSISERDREYIRLAIEQDLDFIAHSFVRSKQDILEIQAILDEHQSDIKIIAKIENQEGVDNINEIVAHCYGVMVARGDLGIEVPQERIPGIQRRLIKTCVQAQKPVIVATQMLHSMIESPRPTRAEVTDVANAIYYRTDALMLSGETAYGKYPVEAVRTMAKIALEAEKTKMPENDIPIALNPEHISSFLTQTAAEAGKNIHLKAIITETFSGQTARYLASHRSPNRVIAFCYKERASRELALSYGVYSFYKEEWVDDEKNYFRALLNHLIERQIIAPQDRLCYVGGPVGGVVGPTFLEINTAQTLLQEMDHDFRLK